MPIDTGEWALKEGSLVVNDAQLQSDRQYQGNFRVRAEEWRGWLSETLTKLSQDSSVRSVSERLSRLRADGLN